jgi:hypothetical protein
MNLVVRRLETRLMWRLLWVKHRADRFHRSGSTDLVRSVTELSSVDGDKVDSVGGPLPNQERVVG